MSKYINKAIEEFKERIRGEKVSIFLDYDGTLTPIVGRPESAQLSYLMRELLKKLKKCYPVAIISGRRLDDLQERVGIDGVVYAGNHGLEIYSEEMSFQIKGARRLKTVLNKITGDLEHIIKDIKGVIIENKGLTASIHYRLIDRRDVPRVIEAVKEKLSPYMEEGKVRVAEGKKVIEVRPSVDWDKGKAVKWILRRGGFKRTLPVYIGDDETDRDAFRVLKDHGISIVVGHGWEDADYFFKGQDEVNGFLKWLASR
jgi:alpha,alpha-trehalase